MFEPPTLQSGAKHRVYWITKRIAQGHFATPARAIVLRDQGVTHVLNVGESGSIIAAADFNFTAVRDCPIVDLELIPDATAIAALDALHAMLMAPGSRVFIHCVAGQNRSPTVLWLYLVACGMAADAARTLISHRSPDSVPGHCKLVDERLVGLVTSHGANSYLPLSDSSILEPAY